MNKTDCLQIVQYQTVEKITNQRYLRIQRVLLDLVNIYCDDVIKCQNSQFIRRILASKFDILFKNL